MEICGGGWALPSLNSLRFDLPSSISFLFHRNALAYRALAIPAPSSPGYVLGCCNHIGIIQLAVYIYYMADVAAAASPSFRMKKTGSSSSFRLRSSPSLNSLRLRRIFDLFDKNGDGMITVEDLSQALSLLGLDAETSELESTIQSHITPGNLGLTYEDFVSLHQSLDSSIFGCLNEEEGEAEEARDEGEEAKKRQEESDLTEAFKVFDVDGDGYISAYELQVVLRKLGLPEATEMDRVKQMIVSVDRNQDGRVDFFEFKDMMRSVLVKSS